MALLALAIAVGMKEFSRVASQQQSQLGENGEAPWTKIRLRHVTSKRVQQLWGAVPQHRLKLKFGASLQEFQVRGEPPAIEAFQAILARIDRPHNAGEQALVFSRHDLSSLAEIRSSLTKSYCECTHFPALDLSLLQGETAPVHWMRTLAGKCQPLLSSSPLAWNLFRDPEKTIGAESQAEIQQHLCEELATQAIVLRIHDDYLLCAASESDMPRVWPQAHRRFSLAKQDSQRTEPRLLPQEEPRLLPPVANDPPLVQLAQFAELLPAPTPAGHFVFNFDNAPWDFVFRRLGEASGYSLRIEDYPPGTFTYYDKQSYPYTEAIDIINGDLLRRGYAMLRKDQSLILINLAKGIPPHLTPRVQLSELDFMGQNEVASVVINLQRLNAQQAARDVATMLSPFGTVTSLTHTNQIMVTDVIYNIRRIHDLLLEGDAQSHYPLSMIVKLKNIPAVDVALAVKEFVVSQAAGASGDAVVFDPDQVIVVAEPNSNSVMVTGPEPYLRTLAQMIKDMDTAPQVIIQALLVEVELDNLDEFGVELGVQDSVLFDRSVLGNLVTLTETIADPATGILTTNQRVISQDGNPGFAFNNSPLGNNVAVRPSSVGSQALSNLGVGRVNGELGFGGLVLSAGSESVSVLLRALASRRQVDVLSRPQIRTIENHEALIQIGTQVPVVDGVTLNAVGSANPVIRQDQAGIILRVLPRVTPKGFVVMEVAAERSSYQTGPGSGVPIFTDIASGNVIESPIKNLTQAQATVGVQTGETIVLGGMITKDTVVVERKVPWLGDIPFLGRAFRHDLQQVKRRELLIFLTPRVIHDVAESGEVMAQEMERVHFPMESAQQMHGPFAPGVVQQFTPAIPPGGLQELAPPLEEGPITPVPVAPARAKSFFPTNQPSPIDQSILLPKASRVQIASKPQPPPQTPQNDLPPERSTPPERSNPPERPAAANVANRAQALLQGSSEAARAQIVRLPPVSKQF